jgi:hypothetical protein
MNCIKVGSNNLMYIGYSWKLYMGYFRGKELCCEFLWIVEGRKALRLVSTEVRSKKWLSRKTAV